MGKPIAKFSDKKNPALIPICIGWCLVWNLYGRLCSCKFDIHGDWDWLSYRVS